MNNFTDLVMKRKSVRAYTAEAVPRETLMEIAEVAGQAPSAKNLQPWQVLIAEGEAPMARLGKAYPREWFIHAPAAFVVCGVLGSSWVRKDGADYLMGDATILADHLVYASEERGFSTCWVAAFEEEVLTQELNLPKYLKPFYIIALGHAREEGIRVSGRKTVDEIAEFI